MTHPWDEFSKSLAESVPRRETLRRLGAVFAGAVLSPLGLGTAWAGRDPCKVFCHCGTQWQQDTCLAACRACNNDPSRLCGQCVTGYTCSDNDIYNCGACGNQCYQAGPNEVPVCESGVCYYVCNADSIECDGSCTNIRWDPNNCGACGNACISPLAPYCNNGECSKCSGGLTECGYVGSPLTYCTDLSRDPANCGACGYACGYYQSCVAGHCETAAV
jgi:hypothetical protein